MALYLWAIGALGGAAGIAVGYVAGKASGQSEGFQRGKEAAQDWARFLDKHDPGYRKIIPHGHEGHQCSTKCLPPGGGFYR